MYVDLCQHVTVKTSIILTTCIGFQESDVVRTKDGTALRSINLVFNPKQSELQDPCGAC